MRINNIVYTGPTGSGKTTKLFEYLRNKGNKGTVLLFQPAETKEPSPCFDSRQTLILLPDSIRRDEWRRKLATFMPFQPETQSYNSFIKSELVLCYPFVLENCSAIIRKDRQPLFLNYNAARFIFYKVVEKKRETEFLFSPVACDSMRIASELCFGLERAAKCGIAFEETGARLKAAYRPENSMKEKIYDEADAILGAFRSKCLELGVFDQSLAIYLYNEYLLTDERYLASLHRRFGRLVVDDLEQLPQVAIKLIKPLMQGAGSAAFGFNPEAAATAGQGIDIDIINKEILESCIVNGLEGSFTCSPAMYGLSTALSAVIAGTEKKAAPKDTEVEMVSSFELRSEMLEATGRRIAALVGGEGIQPSEIAVLSTFADPVTECFLGSILEDSGIILKNISGKRKVSESPVIRSLLALARLCFPMFRLYPGKDNMRILIKRLFNINPVAVSALSELILAQKPYPFFPDWDIMKDALGTDVIERDKYEYVKFWCDNWRDSNPKLPEFFRRAFIEVLGHTIYTKNEVNEVKQLVDESSEFVNTVSRFVRNPEKDFLDFMGSGTGAYLKTASPETVDEYVSLMTVSTALSQKASFKVIVILSASSRNWLPPLGGGLVNSLALAPGGGMADILTEDRDDIERRKILASAFRCVLKKCSGRLIVFESDYSVNGFENDGILSTCIVEAIGGS